MNPLTAKDLMSPRLMAVGRHDSLHDLVDFLRENRIHGALVKEAGRLVGVVSFTDVVVFLSDETVEAEYSFSHMFSSDGEVPDEMAEKLGSGTVDDVMTPAVFTIDESATAGAVAGLMKDKGIHRVVVTHNDQATGVISVTDMVDAVIQYEAKISSQLAG
jgi:CBS domain-containing protein